MGRKLAVLGIALLIVILSFGLAMVFNMSDDRGAGGETPETLPYVQTQIVDLGAESTNIIAYGRVVPNKRLMLYSEVPGKLLPTEKTFKVGVFYNAGEPIFRIDNRELLYSLKTQRAEMLALLTSLMADIKLDYSSEYSVWENYLEKFDVDSQIPELPEVSGQLKKFLSGRGLYRLYYSIKNQEVRLEKYVISSPYAGTVTLAMAEPGQIVAPGQKLGELSSAGSYEVEISLSDNDLEFAPVGTSVRLVDKETGNEWQGRIIRTAQNVDQQTQTVTTFVSIAGSDIKEGMYLTAFIDGQDLPAVEKIDRNAIIENNSVFMIKDGKLAKQEISVVYKGVEYAYIRGVNEGDTLVTLPPSNLPLGTAVQPMPSGSVYDKARVEAETEDAEVIEEGL